ncbi:DUF6308 family protein [Mycolicibacterium sp. GCM10028919]|uniref:DUF6308 family protein n=1 Tax=Mycolicibacterium sp. GCM10028919 TaxID=3273401 RepID=UPI0036216AE6
MKVHDGGKPRYTGARFEAVAALTEDADQLSHADFVAMSMLSVNVPPAAAIRLLESDAAKSTPCCSRYRHRGHRLGPARRRVGGRPTMEVAQTRQRWPRTDDNKQVDGRQTARLIPIWDSFVEQSTGLGTLDYWRSFQRVLTVDDQTTWNWLGDLRSHQATNVLLGLSPLRVLDVPLRMSVEKR